MPPVTVVELVFWAEWIAAACRDGGTDERIALAHAIHNRIGADPQSCRLLIRLHEHAGLARVPGPGPDPGPAGWLDGRAFPAARPAPAGPVAASLADLCRIRSGESADPTRGAIRFHDHRLAPAWADKADPTALIGRFLFYR